LWDSNIDLKRKAVAVTFELTSSLCSLDVNVVSKAAATELNRDFRFHPTLLNANSVSKGQ